MNAARSMTWLLALAACDATPPAAPLQPSAPSAPTPREPLRVRWAPADGVLLFPDDAPLRVPLLVADPARVEPVRAELIDLVAAHEGAPADTPLALELNDVLEPASIAGVALVRIEGDAVDAVDVDARATLGGRGVRLAPRAPLVVGARYALLARGGPDGLRGADGPAQPSASFACLLAAGGWLDDVDDVDDACAGVPGDDAAARARNADALRALAGALAPVLETLDDAGIAPRELVALATFTVTSVPRVSLDVARGVGPWPSDAFADDDGRPALPPLSLPGVDLTAIGDAAAQVPGFSTSARLRIPFDAPVDVAALGDAGALERGVHLFALDDERAGDVGAHEVDALEHTLSDDGRTAFVRRRPALAPAQRYATVVTRAVTAGGVAVAPSLDAALLRARGPLAIDGRSTTALLDDADAQRLESMRARVAPALDALAAQGTPRASVALAVPFATLDAFAFVDAHVRAAHAVAPALDDIEVGTPFERGLWALMPNVETIVTGTFRTLDALDPHTLRAAVDGPREGRVPFLLAVPDGAEGPVPIVLFGHGLMTAKELAYLVADQLAVAGFATFALDLPFHGERTVCTQDSHCTLFEHCDDDHRCVTPAGDEGSLAVAVDSLWPGGPRIPLATGAAFLLVDDLVASRDHVLQGAVDVAQALRLLGSPALDEHIGGAALAHDDVSWLGVSLGGVYGGIVAGMTPEVGSLALNVPGADFVVILEESSALAPTLDDALAGIGLARGTEEFLDYEDLGHLVLDPVDPLNLAPRATVARPGGWPEKRLLLQMAEADRVVPNAATRVLSAVTGAPVHEYTPLVSNHAFFFDPTSLEGQRARADAVEFLLAP